MKGGRYMKNFWRKYMCPLCLPMADEEAEVKKRIKGVLKYKRPGKWLTLIAVLLCAGAVTGCFFVQKDGQEGDISAVPTPLATATPLVTPGVIGVPAPEVTLAAEPTVIPAENGSVAVTQIPQSNLTPTPLPPSDLELLGRVADGTILAVPVGQTVEVDLDSDGTMETITFGIEGYEKNISYRDIMDSLKYVRTEVEDLYFLKINDTVLSKDDIAEEYWDDNPGHTTYYIFDVDLEDGYKEIGLYFDGPSGDPITALYRYVNGRLYCIGAFCSETLYSDRFYSYEQGKMAYMEMVQTVDRETFQITVPGDGTILCRERIQMLETDNVVFEYYLKNGSYGKIAKLEERTRERYEFISWDHDNGSYNSSAARGFYAYSEPVDLTGEQKEAETVWIPEGIRTSFYAYYPDNGWTAGWVQFAYGENLEQFAWFYKGVNQKGKFTIYLPEETEDNPDDLFNNLSHAG